MKTSLRSASFVLVVVLISGLSGCATAAKAKGGDKLTDQAKLYSYRVKYLCSYLHPFPTVFHWTDINILNPSKTETALVMKKFIASGKQKKPSPIPPKRDEFKLTPNQSANIDCDEIQSMLGKPFSTPMEGFVEIESRTELTVVAVYDKCVPQQRTDVFPRSVVTGRITLDGLVRDQPIRLTGTVVVKKSEPHIDFERNRFVQSTEMEFLDVKGEFNTPRGPAEVEIFENPSFHPAGQISGKVATDTLAPQGQLNSFFDLRNLVARISGAGQEPRDLIVGDTRVVATLTSIPPGLASADVNRYCGEQPETPLYDAVTGKQVGSLAGHCHDPNPHDGPPPPPVEHLKVGCDNASIDVEYIEPVVLREATRDEGKDKQDYK